MIRASLSGLVLALLPTLALAGAEYGPEPAAVPTRLEARALEAVRAHLRPAPRTSPALVLAARELAARAAASAAELNARGALRGALARARAFDPWPAAVAIAAAPDEIPAAVARALPRAGPTHVGAGVVEREGVAWVVLLFSERRARLDPFPRDLPPGARAVLSGALFAPLASPRVFVTRPSGEVVDAGGGADRAFRVPLEFSAAGRHVVEVVAESAGGPEVAALLTVSVGGASLEAPARAAVGPDPADPAATEAAVLAALNATRAARGLPRVTADAEVAHLSRRHAEVMAEARRVAHVLPGSADVSTRLRGAGVAFRRGYENVARGATALEAHLAVEESPAHLANVLAPGATRAGIGVAHGKDASGAPTVYLAEILVEPPDDGAASPLTPDARVREALWSERARLGLAPLTADPALDALARDAAEHMRTRDEPETDGLADRALGLRRRLAAVDVFVAGGPDDAVRSANVKDARFARVGVGVVSGDSARFGKARLWIAVVYTD
jgi:uncharacterized protein YkwD